MEPWIMPFWESYFSLLSVCRVVPAHARTSLDVLEKRNLSCPSLIF
jgi:hypothetical protein